MTLRERYRKEIAPALAAELKIPNATAVPNVKSVTVSVGMSQATRDPKIMELAENTLSRITGQRPVKTKAKKSIAGFKVREGMVVGLRVTLRGPRMWHFLEKLFTVTFPRIRDFRGISAKTVDQGGNVSVGFREFLPFPEIRPDEVEKVHGLEVTISTTAKTRVRGTALLKALGFPFRD